MDVYSQNHHHLAFASVDLESIQSHHKPLVYGMLEGDTFGCSLTLLLLLPLVWQGRSGDCSETLPQHRNSLRLPPWPAMSRRVQNH